VRVSLIVPAYDEAGLIAEVLDGIEQLPFDTEVIVVDDGSTDGTAEVAESWAAAHPKQELRILRQAHAGKGAAIRAAIPLLTGEIAVIQDADMEYDPADVPALIEPIARGKADVVFGTRLTAGRPSRAHLFWHLVGNRALSLLASALYNTTLSDIETGYKAFRTDVLRTLGLRENGFGVEAEIAAKVSRSKLRVYELPIAYYGRTYDEGKKITWRDGLRAIAVLVSLRFRR
jgi:glycosyltransferase involved in cell wall biosynthesis